MSLCSHRPPTGQTARWLALVVFVSLSMLAGSKGNAQVQDKRAIDILHPDLSQTSSFAGKSYEGAVAVGGKSANVRAFSAMKPATLRGGDGSFQTRNFVSPGNLLLHGFETRADRVVNQGAFLRGDQSYATRSVATDELPGANKSASVRSYQPADGRTAGRGKRQDYFDEVRDQKNLSIEDIREILNKPNGRPGSRPNVGVLPALPVNPVPAATVR